MSISLLLVTVATSSVSHDELSALVDARLATAFKQRFAALEEEVGALRKLEGEVGALRKELAALKKNENGASKQEAPTASRGTSVDAASGNAQQHVPGDGDESRRLQYAPSYVSVEMRILHEFADSHQCPNLGDAQQYRAALPIAGSTVSWDPSPTVTSDELSLVAVADDWQTAEIQRFKAPIKLVHDSGCVSPPTLELTLNVSVPALIVGGIDVPSAIDALTLRLDIEGTHFLRNRARYAADGANGYVYFSTASSGEDTGLYGAEADNGRGRFDIVRVGGNNFYHIKVHGDSGYYNSADNARFLLASSADGTSVSVWTHDEGNGRQHWEIVPVEGFTNTYNIKIVGGVSTDRKYLSCGTSWGCSLTSQDDGTGWQHWQLV